MVDPEPNHSHQGKDRSPMLAEHGFDTGDVALNYAEGPDAGPPLVLIHGGGSHWQGFLPVIPALALQWHVYALDLRGHGRSDWTPPHYRLDDYVADLLAFLDRQVARPAVLMGHSLGGMIALLAASRVPHVVRAVILGDTPLTLSEMRARIGATAAEADQHNACSDHPRDPTAGGTALARDFDAVFAPWQPAAVLPTITCPVLFFHADPAHGSAVSDDARAQALQLLPDAEHVWVQGAGHGLWDERPTQVLAALAAFLAALPPG
ncbi:MAG TPA: alpha/beta hydrolase [Ktedonobacterales bacterium]|nr:alpha/beta hydrolase [Ktedonobacterales bacterium]